MKLLFLTVSILLAASLTLHAQFESTKTYVQATTETYEKSSTSISHHFKNVKSKFGESKGVRQGFGEAQTKAPENRFIYNAIRSTFSLAELNELLNQRPRMSIICTFNMDGFVEEVSFMIGAANDSIITPAKIEMLEKIFQHYQIEVSNPFPPDAKYICLVFPIGFKKFIDGSYTH